MPYQPGESGNPAGSKPKSKRFLTILERAIEQDDYKRIRAGCEKLLDSFAEGDHIAAQFIADRLDGKPAQQLIHSGDEDAPLKIVHESK